MSRGFPVIPAGYAPTGFSRPFVQRWSRTSDSGGLGGTVSATSPIVVNTGETIAIDHVSVSGVQDPPGPLTAHRVHVRIRTSAGGGTLWQARLGLPAVAGASVSMEASPLYLATSVALSTLIFEILGTVPGALWSINASGFGPT